MECTAEFEFAAESKEHTIGLAVAQCLPYVIVRPSERSTKAAEVAKACQRTASHDSLSSRTWQLEIVATTPAVANFKMEISAADMQKFTEDLLQSEELTAGVRVRFL